MKQKKPTRVLVAISGGVDSSVAALLMKKKGYEVIGAFMKNWSNTTNPDECNWRAERQMAIKVSTLLEIPLLTFDFEKQYRKEVVGKMFKDYKKGEILVSLAGPLSNLFFAFIFGVILKLIIVLNLLSPDNLLVNFLVFSIFINIILMLFNLIPIPPLDGSRVLAYFLKGNLAYKYYELERYGPVIIMLLLYFGLLGHVLRLFNPLFRLFF